MGGPIGGAKIYLKTLRAGIIYNFVNRADDEDNFVVSSGDHGSGIIFTEIPVPSTQKPDFNEPVHPRKLNLLIVIFLDLK